MTKKIILIIQQKISRTAVAIALAFVLGAPAGAPALVAAAPATTAARAVASTSICQGGGRCGLPDTNANTATVKNILRIVFAFIGAFALMSMTASGFKYITSAGDPGKTSEAKKGVIYAVVGLAVAISAEAIVAFVVKNGAPGP